MDLFGRYIFRQALNAFLLIVLSLTGILWIATALRQLATLTSQGQEGWTFFKMTLLALPSLMAMIAPIALLIASLHTLNRLNTDSELIVMTASGATIWRFARPLALLALLVAGAILLANLFVLPWSVRTLESYISKIRADLMSQVLQPGEFSSPESGLTFHIRDRAPDGRLLGLFMHDGRDRKQALSYLAEEGTIVRQGSQAFLVMHTGHILKHGPSDEGTTIIQFDRYAVDMAQIGAKSDRPELKPRARYLGELLHPDPKDSLFKAQPGTFRSELHERFASPLYPLMFVAIVIAALGQARTNRQNRTQSLVLAFSSAAALRLLGLAAMNLVTITPKAVPLVYALPVGAAAFALVAAQISMTPRRAGRLAQTMEGMADAATGLVAAIGARRQRRLAAARAGAVR